MVGRLDDSVLKKWVVGLKELKYLSLYGTVSFARPRVLCTDSPFPPPAPYLVTAAGWADYFSSFPDGYALEGFGICQSARVSPSVILTRPWPDSLVKASTMTPSSFLSPSARSYTTSSFRKSESSRISPSGFSTRSRTSRLSTSLARGFPKGRP